MTLGKIIVVPWSENITGNDRGEEALHIRFLVIGSVLNIYHPLGVRVSKI
jgi:hypothetical protein